MLVCQFARAYLMRRASQPKLMAQEKKQPDIKVRYSEKKAKQQSSFSQFCTLS